MTSLYLEDVLKRANLDPQKVVLIRHSLNDKTFKKCYDENMIKEYTRHQAKSFAKDAEYWLVFVAAKGTQARFYKCYKVNGAPIAAKNEICPQGFPFPEWYAKEDEVVFNLNETNIMSDLENRLVIDWGKGTINWYQRGTNPKEILGIEATQKVQFKGFDKIVLSYNELKEIIDNPMIYENWHTAMSTVYAIYLISDLTDGDLYVGSAYNTNGLLGRWTEYIKTKHGNNKLMKKKLKDYPQRYKDFQFSVLQILPKNLTDTQVVDIENLWKSKLLSKEFGMNDN